MRFAIDFVYFCVFLLIWPYFAFKVLTTKKYRRGLGQRLGFQLPKYSTLQNKPKSLWLHAVSVGELKAALPLVENLQRELPEYQILISFTTRTGEEVAQKLYPELTRFYFPLDFSWAVTKVLKHFSPDLIVLIELELWPNFLLQAQHLKIPIFLANGRLSARSFQGYARHAWFFRRPFSALSKIAVQNEEYATRMEKLCDRMKLNKDKINIAGNLKYDGVDTLKDPEKKSFYKELFGFSLEQDPKEIVLVCGSTHPGEHEILLALYQECWQQGIPLRMVLVPRHPEEWKNLHKLWKEAGIPLLNRSSLHPETSLPSFQTSSSQTSKLPHCILVDTMGELHNVYHLADLVFVGGSLIPHGGQNMAEPAGLGLPVLIGPYTDNFRSLVSELLAADGVLVVKSLSELVQALQEFQHNSQKFELYGQAAQKVVLTGQGAVEEHFNQLISLLDSKKPDNTR